MQEKSALSEHFGVSRLDELLRELPEPPHHVLHLVRGHYDLSLDVVVLLHEVVDSVSVGVDVEGFNHLSPRHCVATQQVSRQTVNLLVALFESEDGEAVLPNPLPLCGKVCHISIRF